MAQTVVTPHVLEMLLQNWGLFVVSGHWGPLPQTECGSIERNWNSDKSRYVWDEHANVMPHHADDTLGILLEKILSDAPIDYVKPLLMFYGYKKQPRQFAYQLRVSPAQAESLLISAKSFVKHKLEIIGYDQATHING